MNREHPQDATIRRRTHGTRIGDPCHQERLYAVLQPRTTRVRSRTENDRMTGDLENVLAILTRGREIIAEGWAHSHDYAAGLPADEYAEFSRLWSEYYTPEYHPPRDGLEETLELLAETVWDGDELPRFVPPIVIVSNWNEAPERTQQDVLDAYDKTIARVNEMIGVSA
jgi:FMN phosphatase YigB (HAD superfamily)